MSGLVVDLFAGGGGASAGLEAALGRDVDLAINHDQIAIAVHKANHPRTVHLAEDIWHVDPLEATGGSPVDVLWASPDCTHFSVAKGGKPRKKKIRSLAWRVVDWARAVKPKVIFIENVAEFRGWGPLDRQGHPIKAKKGFEFRRWKRALERAGYEVDYRVLDASLYGAPTKRRRLFLIARCDGQQIVWPDPTHGPGRLPVHTAAECIDWSIPCPSIFDRKRPLAEKTLRRVAEGIRRFVIESPAPFIVKFQENSVGQPVAAPLDTVMAGAQRFGLVSPTVVGVGGRAGQSAATSFADPVGTITAKNDRALVVPTLVQTGYGERKGQAPRALDLHRPLGTLVDGQKHGLVAASIVGLAHGEHVERPGKRSSGILEPIGTVHAGGNNFALCSAFLAKHFGGVVGQELDLPIGTITATDHHSPVAATLLRFNHDDAGIDIEQPAPTITAHANHIAEVRAFLTAFYGTDGTPGKGQPLDQPMRTLTARHRLGLVVVHGALYQIVDIGLRMLQPHELLRAQFGRFAEGYDLSAATTKSDQVRLIGNSVCPEIAEAIVRANVEVQEAEAIA